MARTVARVALAFQGVGRGPYRWLLDHYAELAGAKDATKRVRKRISWKAVAATMNRAGVRKQDGSPLMPATVRAAWRRLEDDIAAGRVKPGMAEELPGAFSRKATSYKDDFDLPTPNFVDFRQT